MIQNLNKAIQDQVWQKLYQIFIQFSQGKEFLTIPQLKLAILELLKQDTQEEVNYVLKNIFRIDIQNNGAIDFQEFGNFILKRHCGEISLQRFNKAGSISNPKDKKINSSQFTKLLGQAYSFLNVNINQSAGYEFFRRIDTNKDGFISYAQYIQFIQNYLCKQPKQIIRQLPQNRQTKEVLSRFRIYLWSVPKDICYAYDVDKNQLLDQAQVTHFIYDLLEPYTDQELKYILFNIFELGSTDAIAFQPFIRHAIIHIGQLGIVRFQQQCPTSNKRLTKEQFITVVITTWWRIKVKEKLLNKLLPLFFDKIDKDKDGYISFSEYLRWVYTFLAPIKLYSKQYLIEQDDQENPKSQKYWIEDQEILNVNTQRNLQLKFSNYDLAKRAYTQTLKTVKTFDVDLDYLLNGVQITRLLKVLIRENQDEIFYFVKNINRYDKDGDRQFTFDQIAQFLLQQHFGQITLQRLHKANKIKRRRQRQLQLQQFKETINQNLSYISMQATQQQLKTLFSQIDLDRDGIISYADYFLFLRCYFGNLSNKIDTLTNQTNPPIDINNNSNNTNFIDRFTRLIRSQLKALFSNYDRDKNLKFDKLQITQLLTQIFKMSANQIEYVLNKIFKLNVNSDSGVSYDQLLDLLLRIQIGQLVLKRYHQVQKFPRFAQNLLNLADFTLLITKSVSFLKILPDSSLLFEIFSFIDTDKDGWISYKQYFTFISKYLGGGVDDYIQPSKLKPTPLPNPNSTLVSKQEQLYRDIINELKVIYNNYDVNHDGHLSESQLKNLVKQVLQETSNPELDYIFRNLFRVDPNDDRKVEYKEFAAFIIKHTAEIALQKFHLYQPTTKKTLNSKEFGSIFKNAYKFLKSLSLRQDEINGIFKTLDSNGKGSISYTDFMSWIHFTLVPRVV